MTNKEKVERFKNEARNYYLLKKRIKDIEDDIILVTYEMNGVRGIDYSKEVVGSPNPNRRHDRFLELSEELEMLAQEQEIVLNEIKRMESVASRMEEPFNKEVFEMYGKGATADKLARRNCMSRSSYQRAMFNAILEALE